MEKLSLEQLLRLALQEPNEKEYEEYMAIDTSSVVVPAHVDRKIRRDIRRELEGKKPITVKTVISRIILVALITMSLMFITIMAYGESREGVIRAFVEWKENFIAIHYGDTDKNNPGITDGSSEKMTEAEEPTEETMKERPVAIEEFRIPSYIPTNLIEVPVMSSQSFNIIEYYTPEEELAYVFEQHVWTSENKFFDNEAATVEEVAIANKHIGTIVTYAGSEDIYLVWSDDEYIYIITSYLLEKEEMILVAGSLEPVPDGVQ